MTGTRLSALLDAFKVWKVPRPESGLPIRTEAEERVGAVAAVLAILWVFFVAVWGANGVFGDGHVASVANIGIIGYNMSRYHTLYAYYPFLEAVPSPNSSYMHHPLGVFWVAGLLIKIFGDHNWVLRFPAICYVTATAIFLYRCGRAIWGPLEGALAAFAYGALPITLGFANYHDMEQPVMLGCLVATWGYARFRQTDRSAYALASVAGFVFAILHDWEAYVWGAAFLAWLFARGYVLPERWFGPFDARRFGRYWALLSGAAIVVLALTIGFVISANRVGDLLGMYDLRTAGNTAPLSAVLKGRHVRIELMFTGLGIALGKLAVPVIIARVFMRRNELEALPLFLLLTAVVYYTLFKEGADVHIFWPHPFATYFGLAAGALAASVTELWAWVTPRLRRPLPPWLPTGRRSVWVGAGLVALPLLLVFRDGASLIRLARETGERFMEVHLQSDVDLNTALRWFLPRLPAANDKVSFHTSCSPGWDTQWEVRPRTTYLHQPIEAGAPPFSRAYVMDARFTSPAELRTAAHRYHVHAVSWYWLIDRGAPPAPLDAYDFAEHDPGLLESLSQGATEPSRTVTRDPWATWEWRTMLDQPAEVPKAEPKTDEQLRIAHNAAVARGDAAAAARYRKQLVARLGIHVTARWDTGLELLGVAHDRGAARRLIPYFVQGPKAGCQRVLITATVTRRRLLSTLPVDPFDPNIAYPPPYPCELWKPGHIYAVPVVYRHRAGHEEFTLTLGAQGAFAAPRRLDGPATMKLLTL